MGQLGFGMKLSHSTTLAGTYVDLATLTEVKPFGFKVGKVEATHHDLDTPREASTPGLEDWPEVEATIEWDKTQYPGFSALKRVELFWKITYPDGSTDVFPGYITEVQPATPLKDRMTCAIKIQPQDAATFTAGA